MILVRTLWVVGSCAIANLSAQNFAWTRVQAPSSPSARSQHATAGDLAGHRVVLFGGDDGQVLFDTWLWNGSVWQQAAPAVHPPARRAHAMAYDPQRQRVVLFGGLDGGQARLADTWEWDGATWTQASPAVSPPARDGHAMAFDASSSSVLLFGGTNAVQGALADTWRWNGVNWTQVASATAPVARSGHAMATDSARQRVVLFGGQSPSFGRLADTWEWNGTGWLPALGVFGWPNPSGRSQHQLAFDESNGATVLFGGYDGQALGDTWSFDGGHWTSLTTPAPNPSPRRNHTLAYDPARLGLLLFGGTDGGLLDDTWSSANDRARSYGVGCGAPPLRFVPDSAAPPFLGQVAAATIFDAPAGVADVVGGLSNQFAGPFLLPLTLAGIGMPGCDLLQSAEFFGLGATPLTPTSLRFSLAVPNLSVLLGMHFYLQALALAPGQNPLQAIVSNGIDWTITDGSVEKQVIENFDDESQLDIEASAGRWVAGFATFLAIGGDGRHGAFDTAIAIDEGMVAGKHQYTINTDNTTIPAANTLSGAPVTVTDGRFFFSRMVVPGDVRLRFTGTSPPVITVAGRLDISCEIDIAGQSLAAVPSGVAGQPGGAGGIFGGAGGKGGDRASGFGAPTPAYSGSDGQPARVVAGHGYAGTTATSAGRGSSLFPVSGLSTDLVYPVPLPALAYSPSAAAGGGGGGSWQAGGQGLVVGNNHPDPILLVPPRLDAIGPPAAGGSAVQLFPFPPPTGNQRSSLHFLVGGGGGGGAGSQACLALHLVRTWSNGGGGGGGGGAIALRAGHSLRLAPASTVLANGGSTEAMSGLASNAQPAPGGAGAGGSVVLQSGNLVDIAGVVDVRGGTGGTYDRFANGSPNVVPNSAAVVIQGGAGSPGFVRLEAPGTPTTALLATMLPPPVAQNVAPLVERDDLVAMRSRFYATGLAFQPMFVRYVIEATVDGVPTVFSDDPAVSTVLATVGAPLRALFQAAVIDSSTGNVVSTTPWRTTVASGPSQVGIASDGGNGFRFQLVVDRALANTVVIDRLVVVYR